MTVIFIDRLLEKEGEDFSGLFESERNGTEGKQKGLPHAGGL